MVRTYEFIYTKEGNYNLTINAIQTNSQLTKTFWKSFNVSEIIINAIVSTEIPSGIFVGIPFEFVFQITLASPYFYIDYGDALLEKVRSCQSKLLFISIF